MSNTIIKPTPSLEKILSGEELNFNDGLKLMNDENLFLLGAAADKLRKELIGDNISFVSSYYLNYSNICVASCQLCAFYRKENDIQLIDSFEISTQAVNKQARIFKSVLKLDKNFHIYIHGNRELIEQGIDENGRKYYKIYYEREA